MAPKKFVCTSRHKSPPKPSWLKWAEKNSKPKKRFYVIEEKTLTRFQKPGPMSEKDWRRFTNWANLRARPKKVLRQPLVKPRRRKKSLNAIMNWVINLSFPKNPRQKYEYPPEPDYPYSPKIGYNRPPHRDKCRPFQPIKLPCWWSHEENEMEFWRIMRFPISCSALRYKITDHTRALSMPREYPVKLHCPFKSPKDYVPPERVKMNPKQWRNHLKHLVYLSDPNYKDKCQLTKTQMPS